MAESELERLRLGFTAAYAAYITHVRQISDAARCGERPTETMLRLEQGAFHDLVNAREALFDKLLRHGKPPKMKVFPLPPASDPIDAELEQSCRRLAARYRRKGDFERAAHFERVADKIARALTPRASGAK